MQFGTRRAFKSIQAAHAAILTAWLASSQSYKVGGMILGQDSLAHSPLYLKQKGVEHLINTLLKGTHAGNSVPFDGNLSEIVPQLRQHLLPGASLVILSDFYNTNSEFISFLGYLATHYEVTVIFVYDPLEKDVPEGEVVTLENGSQQAVLDGRSSQFRRSYHEQFRHHQGKLEASCLKNGVNFVALATNQEPKEIFADNTHSLIN